MSEATIQSKIIHNLEKKGWLVVKIIQSTKNGWPDLEAIKAGKTVYIEVKNIGENPDPLQLIRHKQLRTAGATVFVTDDKNFTL
jgi:Holliday junction resolvase